MIKLKENVKRDKRKLVKHLREKKQSKHEKKVVSFLRSAYYYLAQATACEVCFLIASVCNVVTMYILIWNCPAR